RANGVVEGPGLRHVGPRCQLIDNPEMAAPTPRAGGVRAHDLDVDAVVGEPNPVTLNDHESAEAFGAVHPLVNRRRRQGRLITVSGTKETLASPRDQPAEDRRHDVSSGIARLGIPAGPTDPEPPRRRVTRQHRRGVPPLHLGRARPPPATTLEPHPREALERLDAARLIGSVRGGRVGRLEMFTLWSRGAHRPHPHLPWCPAFAAQLLHDTTGARGTPQRRLADPRL